MGVNFTTIPTFGYFRNLYKILNIVHIKIVKTIQICTFAIKNCKKVWWEGGWMDRWDKWMDGWEIKRV